MSGWLQKKISKRERKSDKGIFKIIMNVYAKLMRPIAIYSSNMLRKAPF